MAEPVSQTPFLVLVPPDSVTLLTAQSVKLHGDFHHLAFVARAKEKQQYVGKPADQPAAIVFCHDAQPAALPLSGAPLAVDRFGGWHARANLVFQIPHVHCIVAEHPIAIGPLEANDPLAIAGKQQKGGDWALRLLAEGDLTFTAFGGSPVNNTKPPGGAPEPDVEPIFAFLTGTKYVPLSAEITAALGGKPTPLTYQEMVLPLGVQVPAGLPGHLWNLTSSWQHEGVLDQSAHGFGLPWYSDPAQGATLLEGGCALTLQQIEIPPGNVFKVPVVVLGVAGGAKRKSPPATVL